ncbi:hypothetical protein MIR68_007697 [Amoeboaphelidium protococcarum]|nr:hypothetical protein MIR68_007697 [Amoeboaphelidium protococcarum]
MVEEIAKEQHQHIHPTYHQMITHLLKEKAKMTRQQLQKEMKEHYDVPEGFEKHLHKVLREMFEKGDVKHPPGRHPNTYQLPRKTHKKVGKMRSTSDHGTSSSSKQQEKKKVAAEQENGNQVAAESKASDGQENGQSSTTKSPRKSRGKAKQ